MWRKVWWKVVRWRRQAISGNATSLRPRWWMWSWWRWLCRHLLLHVLNLHLHHWLLSRCQLRRWSWWIWLWWRWLRRHLLLHVFPRWLVSYLLLHIHIFIVRCFNVIVMMLWPLMRFLFRPGVLLNCPHILLSPPRVLLSLPCLRFVMLLWPLLCTDIRPCLSGTPLVELAPAMPSMRHSQQNVASVQPLSLLCKQHGVTHWCGWQGYKNMFPFWDHSGSHYGLRYAPIEKVRPYWKSASFWFGLEIGCGGGHSHNNMNLHLPTISQELAWMRDCDDMDNLQAKFGHL